MGLLILFVHIFWDSNPELWTYSSLTLPLKYPKSLDYICESHYILRECLFNTVDREMYFFNLWNDFQKSFKDQHFFLVFKNFCLIALAQDEKYPQMSEKWTSLCVSSVKGDPVSVFRQQCMWDLEHRGTSGPVHSLSQSFLPAQVASCNSVPVPWGSPHSATPAPDLKAWDARGKKEASAEWMTGHELPLCGQSKHHLSIKRGEVVWSSEKKIVRFVLH